MQLNCTYLPTGQHHAFLQLLPATSGRRNVRIARSLLATSVLLQTS